MVQKNAMILEFIKGEKGERSYQFIVPDRAPYGELFDVAFELLAASEGLTKAAFDKVKKDIEEAKQKAATTQVTAEVV